MRELESDSVVNCGLSETDLLKLREKKLLVEKE